MTNNRKPKEVDEIKGKIIGDVTKTPIHENILNACKEALETYWKKPFASIPLDNIHRGKDKLFVPITKFHPGNSLTSIISIRDKYLRYLTDDIEYHYHKDLYAKTTTEGMVGLHRSVVFLSIHELTKTSKRDNTPLTLTTGEISKHSGLNENVVRPVLNILIVDKKISKDSLEILKE